MEPFTARKLILSFLILLADNINAELANLTFSYQSDSTSNSDQRKSKKTSLKSNKNKRKKRLNLLLNKSNKEKKKPPTKKKTKKTNLRPKKRNNNKNPLKLRSKNFTIITNMTTSISIWQLWNKVIFILFLEYSVTHPLKTGFSRPVIVHRAIFGSLERFIAILCEQTGGKWDFWLSPRQIKLIPIGKEAKEFAEQVYNTLLLSNYSVAVDNSGDQLAKKVRNSQLEGYNFIGVIGPEEIKDKQINLRKRDQEEPIGKFDVPSLLKMFSEAKPPKSRKRLEIEEKSFKVWEINWLRIVKFINWICLIYSANIENEFAYWFFWLRVNKKAFMSDQFKSKVSCSVRLYLDFILAQNSFSFWM